MDHLKLGELPEHRESFVDHNVTGDGKRDGLKTNEDSTIGSQATKGIGLVDGSTTRSVSPNNNQTQERPALSCDNDDIVCSSSKDEEDEIKNSSITQGVEQIEGMGVVGARALSYGQRT